MRMDVIRFSQVGNPEIRSVCLFYDVIRFQSRRSQDAVAHFFVKWHLVISLSADLVVRRE